MVPPASRVIPDSLLRISWSGLDNGEHPAARVLSDDVVLFEFDGHNPVPGFRAATVDGTWFAELGRLPMEAVVVDLHVQPYVTSTVGVSVATVGATGEIYEHAGLEIAQGTEAVLFRFVRQSAGDWCLKALAGGEHEGLLRLGDRIVVVIDGSASMIRWFDSGAVARLVKALQDDALAAGVASLRVTFAAQALSSTSTLSVAEDADDFLGSYLALHGLTTGADIVGATRHSLTEGGSSRSIAVLIADGLPDDVFGDLGGHSRIVVSVLGVSSPDQLLDPPRFARLAAAGVGVALVGMVDQSNQILADILRSALPVAAR